MKILTNKQFEKAIKKAKFEGFDNGYMDGYRCGFSRGVRQGEKQIVDMVVERGKEKHYLLGKNGPGRFYCDELLDPMPKDGFKQIGDKRSNDDVSTSK